MNFTDLEALLSVEQMHTYYGKSHIIQGISFAVCPHECIALLGRNGAGKTTSLRSIMGLTPPRKGRIDFKKQTISGLKPFVISRMGIGYVPEDRQIFSTLTVRENLNLAVRKDRDGGRWTPERAFQLFPPLAARRNNRGHQLSGGEQQMLTIARALMANPELLLLDEPTEGLAPIVVELLLEVITGLKEEGLTILLVEQNVAATREVADRYVILQEGRKVYAGCSADFWAAPELQEEFLGV